MNWDDYEFVQSGWHWLVPLAFLPLSTRWLSRRPFALGVAFSAALCGALWHTAGWLQERERARWAAKPARADANGTARAPQSWRGTHAGPPR